MGLYALLPVDDGQRADVRIPAPRFPLVADLGAPVDTPTIASQGSCPLPSSRIFSSAASLLQWQLTDGFGRWQARSWCIAPTASTPWWRSARPQQRPAATCCYRAASTFGISAISSATPRTLSRLWPSSPRRSLPAPRKFLPPPSPHCLSPLTRVLDSPAVRATRCWPLTCWCGVFVV